MNGELRALTGARGIAAWYVVLYHLRLQLGMPPAIEGVLAKGYLAVDFFFLLSGFVIALAWSDRLRGGGWRSVALFLQRRVARIWPLHLFILAGAAVLALALLATGRHDPAEFPLDELPLHVFLVQNWGFTDRLAWNDPAWSISAELAAYLLFPLIALADWRRCATPLLLAVAAALLVGLYLAMAGAPTLGTDIARLGLARCLAEFATGTIIHTLWSRWQERPGRTAPVMLVAASCLLSWRLGAPETLAVPAALAALLLALALTAGRRGHPLEGRVVHWLGEISYATYLGHFLLWFVFKLLFVHAPTAAPVVIAGYLLAVLASSAALYRWVERPAQRWVNGWRWLRAPVCVEAT